MVNIIGAIFIIVLGSIFHFLYDWTHHNKLVGFFTAVNESTWEHLKLIIAPSLLWFIVEYHFYGNNPNLFFAKFLGLFTMLMIIPLIFYGYTYFTKKNIFYVDIASFIIAVIIGQYVFNLIINIKTTSLFLNHLGILGLILIFFMYITETYVPKKSFLHKDPLTNKYGIKGHFDKKNK